MGSDLIKAGRRNQMETEREENRLIHKTVTENTP